MESNVKEPFRILVVEDSPTQAENLKYRLEQQGYRVFEAPNGEEALTMIDQIRPAVIISDILMPKMDGFLLCKKIKSDENLKNIPVILLTALSDPQDVLKGLECGADQHEFATNSFRLLRPASHCGATTFRIALLPMLVRIVYLPLGGDVCVWGTGIQGSHPAIPGAPRGDDREER